jgi:hypothetical protein
MVIFMGVVIFHMRILLCINILVKIINAKNEYISFCIQLNMFSCMKCFLPMMLTFGAKISKPNE